MAHEVTAAEGRALIARGLSQTEPRYLATIADKAGVTLNVAARFMRVLVQSNLVTMSDRGFLLAKAV